MKVYIMVYQLTNNRGWRVGITIGTAPGILFSNTVYETKDEAIQFIENAQFEIVRVTKEI